MQALPAHKWWKAGWGPENEATAQQVLYQWRFYGRGGGWSPPKFSLPHPLVHAWMIHDFINILIFRVRPHACYMKGTMKKQKSTLGFCGPEDVFWPGEWNRVQLTQTALEPISEDLEYKENLLFLGKRTPFMVYTDKDVHECICTPTFTYIVATAYRRLEATQNLYIHAIKLHVLLTVRVFLLICGTRTTSSLNL